MNAAVESRFDGCFEIEQIRKRVTVQPEPLGDLSQLNPMIAGEVVLDGLKQIYLPNQFFADLHPGNGWASGSVQPKLVYE